jgi:hypothetical protein
VGMGLNGMRTVGRQEGLGMLVYYFPSAPFRVLHLVQAGLPTVAAVSVPQGYRPRGRVSGTGGQRVVPQGAGGAPLFRLSVLLFRVSVGTGGG